MATVSNPHCRPVTTRTGRHTVCASKSQESNPKPAHPNASTRGIRDTATFSVGSPPRTRSLTSTQPIPDALPRIHVPSGLKQRQRPKAHIPDALPAAQIPGEDVVVASRKALARSKLAKFAANPTRRACGEDGPVDRESVHLDRVYPPADHFHPRPRLKLNVCTG